MCSKKAVTVKVRKDNYQKMKTALFGFAQNDLLVGVPQEKSERKGNSEPITNAELMFIHTNGSPIRNIPKRPTIEPAIEENKERIAQMFAKVAQKVLMFKKFDRADLEKIGIFCVNKIKAKFGSDDLVPNSPATIAQKGSDRPLIDTGQLRNSVTYVLRRR